MENLASNPYLAAFAVLTLVNLILLAVLFRRFYDYRKKQKALTDGEGDGDLLAIVLKQKKLLATHDKNLRELGRLLGELVESNRANIRHASVVRFNPFPDTGGNMSFAIALLDSRKNGILISSLHSREGTRIYAKPVESGESKHHLTDEEKQAIQEANEK